MKEKKNPKTKTKMGTRVSSCHAEGRKNMEGN
jgi:hypothetical protein